MSNRTCTEPAMEKLMRESRNQLVILNSISKELSTVRKLNHRRNLNINKYTTALLSLNYDINKMSSKWLDFSMHGYEDQGWLYIVSIFGS